jgi:hypothetical protein
MNAGMGIRKRKREMESLHLKMMKRRSRIPHRNHKIINLLFLLKGMDMIIAFVITLLLIWLFIIINNTYGVIPTKAVLIFNYSISILINLIACATNYFQHYWVFFGVNATCVILASIAIIKLVKE